MKSKIAKNGSRESREAKERTMDSEINEIMVTLRFLIRIMWHPIEKYFHNNNNYCAAIINLMNN